MINIHRKGFSDEQNKMIDEAQNLGEKVRMSLDFVSGIAAMKEPKLMTHLVQAEIMVWDLEFYRPWNPFTSARAYAEGNMIYLNRKAFACPAELCSTIFHEMTHLAPMNFTHGFYKSAARDQSIPYQVGALVLRIARTL